EHTMAMLLAATRRIPGTHADLAGGVWRGDYYTFDSVGPELEGSTVGLVGYGAIGRRVAAMVAGFGAEVLVYGPYVDVPGRAALDGRLRLSRWVVLHASGAPETTGMIGAEQLALMPRGSVLVNCARGALLDYDALCDALESGHLFGAAVDVFPEEPIPAGSRLLAAPNLVMT